MANSVHQNPGGPIWPLGNISVASPGTPVQVTTNVDSSGVNAPGAATTATAMEYTPRCYSIIFQACKAGAAPPKLTNNTGNIYIVLKPLVSGNDITDTGTVIAVLPAFASGSAGVLPPPFVLTAAALNRDSLSPYWFYVDADNANDACQVTLLIQ
jgi:hypothetical protein